MTAPLSALAEIAGKLTEAQRRALDEVCRSNGGGIRLGCRIDENGFAVPSNRAYRRLYELDLIQGKSGAFGTVVHTPLGLALRAHLQGRTGGER